MSKPPAEQITEVGSESAGDPEKAAEHSVEGTQPTECVPESAGKEVEETAQSQPNRLRSEGAIPTAAKGSWSRVFFDVFSSLLPLPKPYLLDVIGGRERESPPSHSTCASHCHSVRHKHHPQFIPHSSFSKVALCFFAFVLGNVKRFSR